MGREVTPSSETVSMPTITYRCCYTCRLSQTYSLLFSAAYDQIPSNKQLQLAIVVPSGHTSLFSFPSVQTHLHFRHWWLFSPSSSKAPRQLGHANASITTSLYDSSVVALQAGGKTLVMVLCRLPVLHCIPLTGRTVAVKKELPLQLSLSLCPLHPTHLGTWHPE